MASSDNYISKFSPQSHFFTDPATISQSGNQKFGPVSDVEFRLTTKFTSSGGMAYAICKGIVLVQPQSGQAGIVNLIVRPYSQPINGLNIKYFVYRGLNIADFFSGDEVLPANATASDFINKINTSFSSFYNTVSPGAPLPPFLSKYIGYDPANQADTLELSDFFFKETEYVESNGEFVENEGTAYELPVIDKGASLGHFVSGACGIDIVLNYGDYKLPQPNDEFVFDLGYARSAEVKIVLNAQWTDYQKKLSKEHVFQFLDAAAYFGFHSIEGGTVEVRNGNNSVKKTGVEIYNEVIHNFLTKNNLYLYIQSDRTRSYDFYGNYKISDTNVNNLKIGHSELALVEGRYETEGWPLIIDNAPQAHSENRNKLFLQLVTDNNINTVLYGQVGQIDNAQHNNFCGANDLRLPDDIDGVKSVFTKIIAISNVSIGADNEKLNIAVFNVILYQGIEYTYISEEEVDEGEQNIGTVDRPTVFNDIFHLINATPIFNSRQSIEYAIYYSEKLRLINSYYDKSQKGISAVQIVVIKDALETGKATEPILERVTYTTEAVDVLSTSVSISGQITNQTQSTPAVSRTVTGSKSHSLSPPFYYSIDSFTDGTKLIRGIRLILDEASIPNKLIIGLSNAENDLLKTLIETSGLGNVKILLTNFTDDDFFISIEDIRYEKYKIGVIGETLSGILKLALPEVNLEIYSLDGRCFFSSAYSEFEPYLNNHDFLNYNTVI